MESLYTWSNPDSVYKIIQRLRWRSWVLFTAINRLEFHNTLHTPQFLLQINCICKKRRRTTQVRLAVTVEHSSNISLLCAFLVGLSTFFLPLELLTCVSTASINFLNFIFSLPVFLLSSAKLHSVGGGRPHHCNGLQQPVGGRSHEREMLCV